MITFSLLDHALRQTQADSVDPILDLTQPQLLNGYSYTAADPINTTDGTGLSPKHFNTIDDTGTTGIRGNTPSAVKGPSKLPFYQRVLRGIRNVAAGLGSSAVDGATYSAQAAGLVGQFPVRYVAHGLATGRWNPREIAAEISTEQQHGNQKIRDLYRSLTQSLGANPYSTASLQGQRIGNVFQLMWGGFTKNLGKRFTRASPATAVSSSFGDLTHASSGIAPYRQHRLLTAGHQGEAQAHHLIEKRFDRVIGGNTDDWQAIIVTRSEHQVFTNAWREAIPYGEGTNIATKAQVEDAARQIYADYPEILEAVGLK